MGRVASANPHISAKPFEIHRFFVRDPSAKSFEIQRIYPLFRSRPGYLVIRRVTNDELTGV